MKIGGLPILSQTVAIGLALGCPTALAEEPVPDLYVSGGIGANFLDDITIDILDGTGFRQDRVLDFGTGLFIGRPWRGGVSGPGAHAIVAPARTHAAISRLTIALGQTHSKCQPRYGLLSHAIRPESVR